LPRERKSVKVKNKKNKKNLKQKNIGASIKTSGKKKKKVLVKSFCLEEGENKKAATIPIKTFRFHF
jgi:hypothetical protein